MAAEKLQVLKAYDGQMDKNKNSDSSLAVMSVKNDIFLILKNGTVGDFFLLGELNEFFSNFLPLFDLLS